MINEFLNNIAMNLILDTYDVVFNGGEMKIGEDNPRT